MALMPTPNWGLVELRWKGRLNDGSPATGQLVITADAPRWLDDTDPQAVSIFSVPIIATIVDGEVAIEVPATDDPDITPNGFTYTIRENLTRGTGRTVTITAPQALAGIGIDINRAIDLDPAAGTNPDPLTRAEFDAFLENFTSFQIDPNDPEVLVVALNGDSVAIDPDDEYTLVIST